MARAKVPITPEVLAWAIQDGGYASASVFADQVNIDPDALQSWLDGEDKPGVTDARHLARALKRPLAMLLLPQPPKSSVPSIAFRHPPGSPERGLTPDERRWVRRARRLQESVRWVQEELGLDGPELPRKRITTDAERVGESVREWLAVSFDEQREWKTASAAFRAWRRQLEAKGLLVLMIPLGKDACRGFSLSDEHAPLIAVNSAWTFEARIFSLFHELGHLITNTASACEEAVGGNEGGDPTERWCEQFAAALLMPWSRVVEVLETKGWAGEAVQDLNLVKLLSRRFKVSLRAAALRLIGQGHSDWSLFQAIPKVSENKREGGGGGGRDRLKKSLDEFGERPAYMFRRAVDEQVISKLEALRQLNITESQLAKLHG